MRVSLAVLLTLLSPALAAAKPPRVLLLDDTARVRADRPDDALAAGGAESLTLTAFRDEVVAFQAVVLAGDNPLADVRVELLFPSHAPAPPGVTVELFVEHYLPVARRSRSADPTESLGWAPGAGPPDDAVLGLLPDALIPLAEAPAFRPYPLAVPAGHAAAVWIDLVVAADAPSGRHAALLRVDAGGTRLAELPVTLEIFDARLPYRAASFIGFYELDELASRLGDEAAPAAERTLWQTLHAHGVDAVAPLVSLVEVARLAPAHRGDWFTAAAGYRGPGASIPPEIAFIGTYGALGEPTDATLALVAELAAALPGALELWLYAIDESCDSPLGPAWRARLREAGLAPRVRAAHTCSLPPAQQDVDLAMVVAQSFSREQAAAARAAGVEVWVYNGQLPRAPTLHTDAHAVAAAAFGWHAAAFPVGRWYLWETTFWNDSNRGGRGPVDLFAEPETFHNWHGDASLGDGILVYPGSRATGSLWPSMRLKRLRRGLQDASLIALAHHAAPERTRAIVAAALPAAFDEPGARLPEPAALASARAELRALVPAGASLETAAARAELAALAAARPLRLAAPPLSRAVRAAAWGFLLLGATLAVAVGLLWRRPAQRRRA